MDRGGTHPALPIRRGIVNELYHSAGDYVKGQQRIARTFTAERLHSLCKRIYGTEHGAARVEVRLHYQSIPPYYLRDRFRTQGPETARLAYITSRLNLKGSPIEGWVFTLAEATVGLP
jgi:hypothetical protein